MKRKYYDLRKRDQKSLYFLALIPCLRTVLQLEILCSDMTAESTVTMLPHKYLAAAYNEGN